MKFVLQWHITEKCNYRCKHCYQNKYSDAWPSLDILKDIFLQYKKIKTNHFWDTFDNRFINFVWWEPFLRQDFLEFLDFIDKNTQEKLHIWILTNWSLVDQKKIDFLNNLKNLTINFQVSIEWSREVNDYIRWIWSYDKIIKTIELCQKNSLPIHLSFTLTNINKDEILNLVDIVEKYSMRIKIRRLVPIWFWERLEEFILSPEDWYKFSIKVHKINSVLKSWYFDLSWCSEVTSYEYNGDWCAINLHRLLVINHDLEIYPCKRLEISLWNLKTDKLVDTFFSEKYIKLLTVHEKIKTCQKCSMFNMCKWWAKCITYNISNKLNQADPQCYRALLINNKQNGFTS